MPLFPWQHFDLSIPDLAGEGATCPNEQLLPGLAACIECALHLHATERAVGQRPTIFSRERNPLSDTLIDHVRGELGKAVDMGLFASVVPSPNRVEEQPLDGVAIVLVVFRGIDPPWAAIEWAPARAILIAKALHAIPLLAQRYQNAHMCKTKNTSRIVPKTPIHREYQRLLAPCASR